MNIAEEIALGQHDDVLDKVQAAVKMRRNQIGAARMLSVGEGTKVRVVGNINPTYLNGLTGEVVRKGPKNITVHFDDPDAARRYRHGIRLPAQYLEVIE